jgi:cupin 2 domain-containing protein
VGVTSGNLFTHLSADLAAEAVETLAAAGAMRLVRIVSTGQATPAGEWYDQKDHEWVIVLRGRAGLRIEAEPAVRTLGPGDHLHIPAGVRHRVEWTAPDEPTVWLALHYA